MCSSEEFSVTSTLPRYIVLKTSYNEALMDKAKYDWQPFHSRMSRTDKEFFTTGIRNQSSFQRNSKVAFDNEITIRSYNTVLGDNPSVSVGPPVSLGWMYITQKRLMRGTGSQERQPNAYHLNASSRFKRLRKNGFSKEEIENGVDEMDRIKTSRRSNSIRSTVITVIRAPASTEANRERSNASEKRKQRRGSLTWAVTPQRSQASLRRKPMTCSVSASSTSNYQRTQQINPNRTKTPFPKFQTLSLPPAA